MPHFWPTILGYSPKDPRIFCTCHQQKHFFLIVTQRSKYFIRGLNFWNFFHFNTPNLPVGLFEKSIVILNQRRNLYLKMTQFPPIFRTFLCCVTRHWKALVQRCPRHNRVHHSQIWVPPGLDRHPNIYFKIDKRCHFLLPYFWRSTFYTIVSVDFLTCLVLSFHSYFYHLMGVLTVMVTPREYIQVFPQCISSVLCVGGVWGGVYVCVTVA